MSSKPFIQILFLKIETSLIIFLIHQCQEIISFDSSLYVSGRFNKLNYFSSTIVIVYQYFSRNSECEWENEKGIKKRVVEPYARRKQTIVIQWLSNLLLTKETKNKKKNRKILVIIVVITIVIMAVNVQLLLDNDGGSSLKMMMMAFSGWLNWI